MTLGPSFTKPANALEVTSYRPARELLQEPAVDQPDMTFRPWSQGILPMGRSRLTLRSFAAKGGMLKRRHRADLEVGRMSKTKPPTNHRAFDS
jgi:hypothetical protein